MPRPCRARSGAERALANLDRSASRNPRGMGPRAAREDDEAAKVAALAQRPQHALPRCTSALPAVTGHRTCESDRTREGVRCGGHGSVSFVSSFASFVLSFVHFICSALRERKAERRRPTLRMVFQTVRLRRSARDLPTSLHRSPCGTRWQPTLRRACAPLKRTDPQTPPIGRRVGGAARSSGTRALRKGTRRRRRPPGISPKRSPQGPRTIPAIVRPVGWAGGEDMMGDGRGGVDFFFSMAVCEG